MQRGITMNIQKKFEIFHKNIKVETDELRDKRDILTNKIKSSLNDAGHPACEVINQGSYIYGVGIKPSSQQEYDIDVGLVFPILSQEHKPQEVRSWVFNAIQNHTSNVEDRGPCIRVRYAAGYHVDLVVYAQHLDNQNIENFQLARKDGTWSLSEPKKLKQYISEARQKFIATKDNSGSDQIQRVTRYLKRWNDLDIPKDSPEKPSGLATLLLVIHSLPSPVLNTDGSSDDLAALIQISRSIALNAGRIIITKPVQQYEDVYKKLDDKAMTRFKQRHTFLLSDLESVQLASESDATNILIKQFGSDFPASISKDETNNENIKLSAIEDMQKAIPSYKNPAKPWTAL